jgi:dCMP deaminase
MNELWDRRFLEMAELVSNWSKDSSTRVGSVIVDGDKRVISTGYNGFPRKIFDNPLDLEDRTRKYQKVLHSEINRLSDISGDISKI